jgi:hypothetical protein
MTKTGQRETILEFRVSGQFGFINAIDVLTGLEVSVTFPAHTAKRDRETLALRRLSKALIENGHMPALQGNPEVSIDKNGGNPTGSPPSRKRGFLA